MNSRERVLRTIQMGGPDRIPILHATLAGGFARHGERLNSLYRKYPSDVILLGETGKGEFSGKAGVTSTDAWGAVWISATGDFKGQVVKPLLETWDDLDKLHPPSPVVDPKELAVAREVIQGNRGERYILVDGDTLWQRMFYLRGFENISVDLLIDRDQARALRDMILDFILERIKAWVELDVHGFELRDDWGTQRTMMINPQLWREFFKPAYQEISDLIHSVGRDFWFHCDGYIREIIPDMIEIGVDVINPEVYIMGMEEAGKEFGGRVCFLVDIDKQRVLPFGTPGEVRECVRKTIEAFGRFNGGCLGRGQVGPDVPLENVEAMFEAFMEFGTYS